MKRASFTSAKSFIAFFTLTLLSANLQNQVRWGSQTQLSYAKQSKYKLIELVQVDNQLADPIALREGTLEETRGQRNSTNLRERSLRYLMKLIPWQTALGVFMIDPYYLAIDSRLKYAVQIDPRVSRLNRFFISFLPPPANC